MNDYLIDTQTVIWFIEDDEKLPRKIKSLMEKDDANLIISIASLWEMTIKASLKKLSLSKNIAVIIETVVHNGFELMPIEPAHLITLSELDYIHRDPFDRIIISQALTAHIPVISSDAAFAAYPIKTIWRI